MKRGWLGRGAWTAAILVALAGHGSAWALTDEEIFRDFRFNFINPGGRALGLGGAFIAAADDATASQANPAALHYVYYKEVFAEYRQGTTDTQVFAPTQGFGSLDPNNPSLPFLELQALNNREDTANASFFSFAYPFRAGNRRLTLAVSRQVVLDVTTTLTDPSLNPGTTNLRFATDGFPIWVNPGGLGCGAQGVEQYSVCNTSTGELDSELVHYNVAASMNLTSDFSIGVTLTWADLDMTSEVLSETRDPRGALFSQHPRVDTGGGNLSNIRTLTTIDDSDSGLAWSLGLHWHPDSAFPGGYSPIRFGLVYRKGADLSVDETTAEFNVNTGAYVPNPSFENSLRVPDRYGLGVSYQTEKHWTFSFDVERIEYSDLMENFQTGVNFFTSPTLTSVLVDPNGAPFIDVAGLEFTVDDATVFHGGVQYGFKTHGGWAWALRGGYYNAPDNRIRLEEFSGNTSTSTGQAVADLYEDVFRGAEDEDHMTAGFSVAAPTGLEFQMAADFADESLEIVSSLIWRFGSGL